tara:strand:+ start:297 stop:596 length:300 start_codon:yes stop_codon:yes gene_type:complete
MSQPSSFVTQVGIGMSEAISILDTNDVRISYGVFVVEGSATYTVQHSLGGDDFINNTDNQDMQTTQDGNYVFPVQQIRVHVTAGTGTVRLHVIQLVVGS